MRAESVARDGVTRGRTLHVGRNDPHGAELGSDLGQRGDPRAINPIIVRDQNSHAWQRGANTTARCGLDFELVATVNVWILCNEDAGRGLSADDLRGLSRQAGHTVLGVAKQYDERHAAA